MGTDYLSLWLSNAQGWDALSAALWPELNNASLWGLHDPEVVSRIWLTDGRSYQFRYNADTPRIAGGLIRGYTFSMEAPKIKIP